MSQNIFLLMLFYLGSATTPTFINKVLLEQSHAHSFIYCLWLLLLQQHNRLVVKDHMACKPKNTYYQALKKKFSDPYKEMKRKREENFKSLPRNHSSKSSVASYFC